MFFIRGHSLPYRLCPPPPPHIFFIFRNSIMGKFMKYAKKTAVKIGKAAYGAAKKRYVTKGGPNVKNIAKDVMYLKSVLNPEKKRYETGVNNAAFAQVLNSSSVTGSYLVQIPFSTGIVQGTTSSTRNGNSIKCNSIIMKIRLNQQSNCINSVRYRIIIFTIKGVPQPANAQLLTSFYDPNIFSSVVDYNSDRNPDNYMDFQILGQRQGVVLQDSLATQTGFKDITIPIKTNKHMRWNNAGGFEEFPVYIMAVADSGDAGTAATGLQLQYSARCYYYDN